MRASTSPAVEVDGLYRRLVWTTLLRIGLVSVLLAAASLAVFRAESPLDGLAQALFVVVIAIYAASVAYLLVLRSVRRWHRMLAWAQVLGDVLTASCLVWLTGGAESILVFLFPLAVVSAAALLYRRGAVFAAVLASAALSGVAVGINSGWLPTPGVVMVQGAMSPQRLGFSLASLVGAIFLSAALSSQLGEQLRTARERLTRKEHDYQVLERLHESIVQSVASGILTADRFGRIAFMNSAAEAICGFGLAAALGEPVERWLPEVAPKLGAPGPQRFEADHLTATGARRRLGFAVSPLIDREGRDGGHVVAVEDLTGIRLMEESLKRSERLAAMGALAAGLAHELRNPLAAMSGSIQMLRENPSLTDDEARLMAIVIREADRLNALVGDFLRFARPVPAQLEPIDLREVVGTTTALFRNDPSRKGIELQVDLPDELPVMGDAGQLGQVLWNLLANAAEAMPSGGRVTVRGSAGEEGVLLEVRDEGPGIAPEDVSHVFEPFFSRKARGTGLGLAIVHAIVQAHGGEAQVASEPGRGASITVRLPRRGAGEAGQARPA